MHALVDQIVGNFPDNGSVKIEKNIGEFVLCAKRLSTLAIILNELLTNIMKYAFVGRAGGLIIVSASLENNLVTVLIQDNGIGMPEAFDFEKSTGFGLMLVGKLIKQLSGVIRVERGNGTRIVLEFEK